MSDPDRDPNPPPAPARPLGIIGRAMANIDAKDKPATTVNFAKGSYGKTPEQVLPESSSEPEATFSNDPELPEDTIDKARIRQYVIDAFKVADTYRDKVPDSDEKQIAGSLKTELLNQLANVTKSSTVAKANGFDQTSPIAKQSGWGGHLKQVLLVITSIMVIVIGGALGGRPAVANLVFIVLPLLAWILLSIPSKSASDAIKNTPLRKPVPSTPEILHRAHTHLLTSKLTYYRHRALTLTTSFNNHEATLNEVLSAKITLESEKRRLFRTVQTRSTQLNAALEAKDKLQTEVAELTTQKAEMTKLLTPELRDQIQATLTLAECHKMKAELDTQLKESRKACTEAEEATELAAEQRLLYSELKDKQSAINKLECKRWAEIRSLADKETREKYDALRKKEEDEELAAAKAAKQHNANQEDNILQGEKFKYRKAFQMASGAPRMTAAERWQAKKKEDKREQWALVLRNREEGRVGLVEDEKLEKEVLGELEKKDREMGAWRGGLKKGLAVIVVTEKQREGGG